MEAIEIFRVEFPIFVLGLGVVAVAVIGALLLRFRLRK